MTDETPEAGEELRVSTLELFFDLVFVFVITRLATLLEHDLSWAGVGRSVLVFVALYWMYSAFVWLTNQLPPARTPVRLLLVAGMAGFLVCALAVPHAFSGDGVVFGIGLLVVVLVHAGLFALAYGTAVLRWAPFNVLGCGLIIWAGTLDAWWRYLLWVVPLGLDFLAARGALSADPDEAVRLRPGHFVERHGLLLIVAFGESVVAVGAAAPGRRLDGGTIVVAVLGLALSAALWWVFFAGDDEDGEAAMRAADVFGRMRLALNAYFASFAAMLLGIVLLAAGTVLALGGHEAHPGAGPALLLGGGVALYLLGQACFRVATGLGGRAAPAVVAVLALSSAGLGVAAGADAQLAALTAVAVALVVVDARR